MVKVFYEPPPFGPRSALNRSPYGSGVNGGSMLVRRMSTLPPAMVITGAVSFMAVLAYLPLMNQKLPFTCSPEYLAAQRAYMRYHNMNPIFGVSSKEARAADAAH